MENADDSRAHSARHFFHSEKGEPGNPASPHSAPPKRDSSWTRLGLLWRDVTLHVPLRCVAPLRYAAALALALALSAGCGTAEGEPTPAALPTTALEEAKSMLAAADAATFSGSLALASSARTANAALSMGVPFSVTESATNTTDLPIGPINLGVRHLGFTVTAATKPRTGICRIAGSATCSAVELAPHETQTYTLTLVPLATGTQTITGWATSSYVAGGSTQSLTVTVK